MAYNMASNGNVGYNRKRRDKEFSFSDDYNPNSFDKKVKMEQDMKFNPSCVIHVRNVSQEMDDTALSNLAVPFGYVVNIVIVRKHNQALIQMKDKNDAVSMVNYYSKCIPYLYGKHLFVQYSKHQQLDIRSNNANIEKLVQNLNEKRENYLNNWVNCTPNGASEILRILIENAPNLVINHLVFYKIFRRYGDIVRIVSYTKNNSQHHGLVEFLHPLGAHVAQLQLNGLNLLGDNGTMRVDFSKNPGPLQVQRPSDKVRDYSISPLNMSEAGELDTPQYDFPLFSNNTNNAPAIRESFMDLSPVNQFAGMTNTSVDISPVAALAAVNLMAACNQLNQSQRQQQQQQVDNSASSWGFNAQNNQMFQQQNQIVESSGNSVVLVTNLNAEKSNPDDLFTLFGVYGDVLRVKVMFNKKNTALVQFNNHQQAMTAIMNLDGCFLWGKPMHLHVSKTNVIQMPMEDSNHGMTKDYANSNLHRFKKPNSKNFQNIYQPGSVLHLSNIPPSTNEDDLQKIFENANYGVKKFKFLPNDKKMALIELCSVEDAIHALIEFHNVKLSEKNHLRISFSKAGAF